jgi:hypothetical protein
VNTEQELVQELAGERGWEQAQGQNQGFSTEDILWSLGIWSVILCLAPVILFYMMMVA